MRGIAFTVVMMVLLFSPFANLAKAEEPSGILAFDVNKNVNLRLVAPDTRPSLDASCEGRITILDGLDPFGVTSSFQLADPGQPHSLAVQSAVSDGAKLLDIHSGYHAQNKQCAENIREREQGYLGQSAEGKNVFYDSGTRKRQREALTKMVMTISQDSLIKSWITDSVVIIPAKNIKGFSKSPDDAVGVTKSHMSVAQSQSYAQHLAKGEQPLMLVTCLWGSDSKIHDWGSAGGRIVMVMFEKSPDN